MITQNTLQQLPSEILLKIFGYLDFSELTIMPSVSSDMRTFVYSLNFNIKRTRNNEEIEVLPYSKLIQSLQIKNPKINKQYFEAFKPTSHAVRMKNALRDPETYSALFSISCFAYSLYIFNPIYIAISTASYFGQDTLFRFFEGKKKAAFHRAFQLEDVTSIQVKEMNSFLKK